VGTTTTVAVVTVPQGNYQKVSAVVSPACLSGQSVALTNNNGSFSSSATLSAEFNGTISADGTLKNVVLDLQLLVAQLEQANQGSDLITSFNSVTGLLVPSNGKSSGGSYAAAVLA